MTIHTISSTYPAVDTAELAPLLREIAETIRETWTGAEAVDFTQVNGGLGICGVYHPGHGYGWIEAERCAGVSEESAVDAMNEITELATRVHELYGDVRDSKAAEHSRKTHRPFSVQVWLTDGVPFDLEFSRPGFGITLGAA